jgi:hypothetical protein
LHFIISTKIDIQLISSSSEIEVSVIKSWIISLKSICQKKVFHSLCKERSNRA